MANVDVRWLYNLDQIHYQPVVASLDNNMPDEDEVKDIARPLIQDDGGEFLSTASGDVFPQGRGLLKGLLFHDISGVPVDDFNSNHLCIRDELFGDFKNKRQEYTSIQPVTHVQSSDVPAFYQVCGLLSHEMAVIGVYVDQRIMPGFNYRVRIASTRNSTTELTKTPHSSLFGGQALHLVRIGQGYGKRLTFTSENKNDNTNYFWSDSNPAGYGFSIVAVQTGDKMVLTDLTRRPIGRGTVEEVNLNQAEIGTDLIIEDGTRKTTVVKRVSVVMKVLLQYTCERHGMRSIRADETVIVQGVAKVIRKTGESLAHTKCIEQFELPNLGRCCLYLL